MAEKSHLRKSYFLEIVLDELKKTARGDWTYADSGGVVLNEDDYGKNWTKIWVSRAAK